MKYRIASIEGAVLADGLDPKGIETRYHELRRRGETQQLLVERAIAVTINGTVVRDEGLHEALAQSDVVLSCKGKEVRLKRDTRYAPGDIGVSCSPNGPTAPVDSINIQFRPDNDTLTDRGLVWMIAGSPTLIRIGLKPVDAPKGTIVAILREAEAMVREKVLKHFPGVTRA